MNWPSYTSRDFLKQLPILHGNCRLTHTSPAALPGRHGMKEKVSGSQVPQMKCHHEKLSSPTTLNCAVQGKLLPPRAVQTSDSEKNVPQRCTVLSPHLPFLGVSFSVVSTWKSNVQPWLHPLNSLKGSDSIYFSLCGYFVNLRRKSIFVGTVVSATDLESYPSHSSTQLRNISIELSKLTGESRNKHLHLFYAETK